MSTLRKLRRRNHTVENRLETIPWGPLPYEKAMSEVLLEFANPLLDDSDSNKSFRGKITMAAFCWNLALMPSNEQKAEINKFMDEISGRDAIKCDSLQEILHVLVDRKKALFTHDNRLIVNYEIIQEKAGPRLIVMSIPYQDYLSSNK